MTNIGYIPVYNYIVKIEVLDNEQSISNTHFNNIPELSLYVTKKFIVLDIIDYMNDNHLEKIEYKIDEFTYYMYKHLQLKDTKNINYKTVNKSYEINKTYNDHRYYYLSYDRSLNQNFMIYKLYTKFSEGYSGIHNTYHDNWQIKEKYFHNNGIKEGLYQLFYTNGNIEAEINYINDIKHGLLQKYNGNHIDVLENYNMGKLHGLCVYNNYGRASTDYKVEITYKNGIIDGLYKKYFRYKLGGGLQIECNFTDGKYFGLYKEYDINGNLLIECDYKTYNKNIELKDIS